MDALPDATTVENPSFGLTPTAIPEPQNAEKGVSVEYVPQEDDRKKWYLFRASYGREDLAAELLRKAIERRYKVAFVRNNQISVQNRPNLQNFSYLCSAK